MDKCKECPYYRRLQLIKKYMPTVVNTVLTSALNNGNIEENIYEAIENIIEEDNDRCD